MGEEYQIKRWQGEGNLNPRFLSTKKRKWSERKIPKKKWPVDGGRRGNRWGIKSALLRDCRRAGFFFLPSSDEEKGEKIYKNWIFSPLHFKAPPHPTAPSLTIFLISIDLPVSSFFSSSAFEVEGSSSRLNDFPRQYAKKKYFNFDFPFLKERPSRISWFQRLFDRRNKIFWEENEANGYALIGKKFSQSMTHLHMRCAHFYLWIDQRDSALF